MSLREIAATPTTASASRILSDAAQHAEHGPFHALRLATFGSLNPDVFLATSVPEQAIAESAALIVLAGLINPDIHAPRWPDPNWTAGEASNATGHAHRLIGAWAANHTAQQLRHLLEAAADRARREETGR